MRLQVLKGIIGTNNLLYSLPAISKSFGSGTDTVQCFAEQDSARFWYLLEYSQLGPSDSAEGPALAMHSCVHRGVPSTRAVLICSPRQPLPSILTLNLPACSSAGSGTPASPSHTGS